MPAADPRTEMPHCGHREGPSRIYPVLLALRPVCSLWQVVPSQKFNKYFSFLDGPKVGREALLHPPITTTHPSPPPLPPLTHHHHHHHSLITTTATAHKLITPSLHLLPLGSLTSAMDPYA